MNVPAEPHKTTTLLDGPDRLRICHFISGDLWAGAEVMAWRLMEGLRDLGTVDLSIILCNHGELHDKILGEGFDRLLLDEKIFSPLEIFMRLKKYLGQHRPHVLHCHRYKENILGYLAGRCVKIPALITTQHGMPESSPGRQHIKSKIFSAYNFFIQKQFDAVVAVSSDIQRALVNEYSLPAHIVYTIRNGVPLPERLSSGSPDSLFVIGSAGRFAPVKDYDLMVRVALIASQQDPELRFMLAGDGSLREQIQNSIATNNLARQFMLIGALQEMEAFYLGLDLYINTSLHEGIPMTILEAMSYGLPIVACDVGGIREIIDDGVTGFLVPNRDPQTLAEKCLLLRRDRSLWKKMSAAARKKIETSFSDAFMADQYLALYRQVHEKNNWDKKLPR